MGIKFGSICMYCTNYTNIWRFRSSKCADSTMMHRPLCLVFTNAERPSFLYIKVDDRCDRIHEFAAKIITLECKYYQQWSNDY